MRDEDVKGGGSSGNEQPTRPDGGYAGRSYEDIGDDTGDAPGRAVCATCRCVGNVSHPWYRWHCLEFPRRQTYNPVTGQTVADPPYHLCKVMNPAGYCKRYDENPAGSVLDKKRKVE